MTFNPQWHAPAKTGATFWQVEIDGYGYDCIEPQGPQHWCDHDWQPTENWLIDRCANCGEERA